jgi:hypothetical protein
VQRRSVVAVARGDIAVRREQALGDVDVIALCSDEQRRHAFDSAARSTAQRVAVICGGQQCRAFAAARVEERFDGLSMSRRHSFNNIKQNLQLTRVARQQTLAANRRVSSRPTRARVRPW